MYAHVYLLYINIIKFEIYIRLNQPCINTTVFASIMSAAPSPAPAPATAPSPAPVPSPSQVLVMLQSLITTPPKKRDPVIANNYSSRINLALKEVKEYDDDVKQMREEGPFHYSAEDHKQVIAQEQEEWEKWYNEYLIKFVPELQPTPQKVEEQ